MHDQRSNARINDGTWPRILDNRSMNLSCFFLISPLLQNNWPLIRAKASDSRFFGWWATYQHAEDRYKISRQREILFADVTNASCHSFISLSLIGAIFFGLFILPTFSHVAELSQRDCNWRKIASVRIVPRFYVTGFHETVNRSMQ